MATLCGFLFEKIILVEGFRGVCSNRGVAGSYVDNQVWRKVYSVRSWLNKSHYQIRKAPVADHHTQGHVENLIGYNTDKINACLLNGPKKMSNLFWELANRFVDHALNFCFHAVLGMTPYGGTPIDTRWFLPFGIWCWAKHSRGPKGRKIRTTIAYRAYFIGFVDIERLELNYNVIPCSRNVQTNRTLYEKTRSTKTVIFDSVYTIVVTLTQIYNLRNRKTPLGS